MPSETIDTPLVKKIQEKLCEELSSGNFALNDRLPTNREWAKRLGVSSFTIYRAIELFKKKGFVETTEGSFTFLRSFPPKNFLELIPKNKPVTIKSWDDRTSLEGIPRSFLRHHFQERFFQNNPHIKLEEKIMTGTAAEVEELLIKNILKGGDPTYFYSAQTKTSSFSENGILAPIVPAERENFDFLAKINPEYLNVCSSRTGNGETSLVMLPSHVTHSHLFYNKLLFKKAGLDPNRPPRNMEEFLDYAKKLTASSSKPSFYLVGLRLIWWLMSLTYQNAPSPSSKTLPSIDWMDKSAKKSISFMIEMFKNKLIHWDANNSLLNSHFTLEEVPMMFGSPWLITGLLNLGHLKTKEVDESFGIASMPVGENGKPISLANCNGWLLNARASEEERVAATKYLFAYEDWLRKPEGAQQLTRLGILPGMHSIFSDSREDHSISQIMPNSWLKAFEELKTISYWEAPGSDWKKNCLNKALSQLMIEKECANPEFIQEHLILQEYQGGFLAKKD